MSEICKRIDSIDCAKIQAASEESIRNFCFFVYLSHQYFQSVQISTILLETCKKMILYVQSPQL